MKHSKSVLAVPALLLCAATAQAEISANVALTSDYVWRGVSQSDEDPAIQGGFDYSHDSGLYMGVWGSNVDFDEGVADPADLELDFYAGYATEMEGVGIDAGFIRYLYPGTSADLNWTELYVALSYNAFSASINYSDDVFATDEDGIYYTLGYGRELGTSGFSLSAKVGYYDLDDDSDDYTDWQLGVSTEVQGVGVDLSYFDTDIDDSDWAEDRLVLTLSKAL